MPTQSRSRPSGLAIVLGALVGVFLGCARATPKEGVWFDACCDSCSGGACDGCNETKDACEGSIEAECLVDNEMMMCRPAS